MKYVLREGVFPQVYEDTYELSNTDVEVSKEEFQAVNTQDEQVIAIASLRENFHKQKEQQDLKQTLVDSFTVDQLKKLKEMLS